MGKALAVNYYLTPQSAAMIKACILEHNQLRNPDDLALLDRYLAHRPG